MSKRRLLLLMTSLVIGCSFPVYGKDTSLNKQGNVTGFQEQICNMKEDYLYLEMEIQRLLEECN